MLASPSGETFIGLAALVSAIGAAVASIVGALRTGKARTEVAEVHGKVDRVEAKVDESVRAAGAIVDRLNEHYVRVEDTYAKNTAATVALLAYLQRSEAGK